MSHILLLVVAVVTSVLVCCCGHQRLQILPCFYLSSLLWAFPLSCPSSRVCLFDLSQLKPTVII